MSMSDPLGDMLTRIRNGLQAKLATVACPNSRLRRSVLDVLKREGYIRGYNIEEKGISIELKYAEGQPAIRTIKRVSTPGRRVYSNVKGLRSVQNGLGITILSTPNGVMSDHDARRENVGGELLCEVF
ncbi:MAG: 30S ribosomal protein S8 [Rhodospirillales bacterium]|nr:30S ribosomal protein S8 [Rhodospirillales bacterium]USO06981.1 MAG: 30S ribosomal protein S8 [Rhodospirillales bacterium]